MGYEVQITLQTLAFPSIVSENPKSYFTPLDPLRNGVLSPSACWPRGFAYGAPKFLPHKKFYTTLEAAWPKSGKVSECYNEFIKINL
jgi:hypothetical protein